MRFPLQRTSFGKFKFQLFASENRKIQMEKKNDEIELRNIDLVPIGSFRNIRMFLLSVYWGVLWVKFSRVI